MDLLPFALLRSVMRFGGEPEADILQNLTALRIEVRPVGIDQHLLTYISQLADRSTRVPTFKTVYAHYTHLSTQQDPAGQNGQLRLWEVENAQLPFLDPAAYRAELDRYREKVTGDTIAVMLQQTADILKQGHTPQGPKGKTKTFKGPDDAMVFMESGLTNLRSQFHTGDIEGSVRLNATEVWDRYQQTQERARNNQPLRGVLTGIEEIDDVHDGVMAGELALVVGYTSHFKSTFCFNWAYDAAVNQGKNVAIIPMETSAKSLLTMMAVRHCCHDKYEKDYRGFPVLYDGVRKGMLGAKQEELFKDALDDLQTNPAYGQILYMEPQGITTVNTIKRWLEQQDRKVTLDLVVLDYLGLVDPSLPESFRGGSVASGGSGMLLSLTQSSMANAAVREVKQLCTSFGNGRGVAMISPWQSNRDGVKEAEKNNGQYSLRALSWANEAERSADIIYSVYIDESRRRDRELIWGNLKARDRQQFEQTIALRISPARRAIVSMDSKLAKSESVSIS